jgi:phosphoribosylformylglycinamidine synthase
MKFIAEIDVMPHKELLDPQGKTVVKNMKNIHLQGINDVRIGKHIQMTIEADSQDAAKEKVETACKKLLSNMIMEGYSYDISPAE